MNIDIYPHPIDLTYLACEKGGVKNVSLPMGLLAHILGVARTQ